MKKRATEYIIPDYIKNGNQITYNDKVYYEINRCLGYKPDMYFISLDGEIYSKSKGGILCPTTNKDEYLYQGIRTVEEKNMKISVAKVMLTTFRGEPPAEITDPTTEHINGIRSDNRIDNLIWLSRSDNCSTRTNKGKGETNSKAKLTESNVKEICRMLQKKQKTIVEIAAMYNVSKGCIQSIKKRQNWTYISDHYTF